MAETSSDRVHRWLTLVPWLVAHSGISKADAARHFGISVAQLESDLQLISFTGPGLYGGELIDISFDDTTVTVFDHQGLTRPLALSVDEASTLLLGLQALQQLPDIDAALVAQVSDKLEMYAGARSQLSVQVDAHPFAATIATAIAQATDVVFTYVHPLRDDARVRTVTPIRVMSRDGIDYLTGWCLDAEAVRTFRLDRMLACALGGPSQTRPDTTEIPISNAALVAVDLRNEYLLERVPHTVVERGSMVVARVEFADLRWLAAWVIGAEGEIRVLEPLAVARGVSERAQSAHDAYRALD